jgi:hypothetical protein
MDNFSNETYSSLIDDLICDSFYLEKRSLRGKIATLRQYSEIIIRKIFNLPETEKVTLGRISNLVKQRNNSLLKESIETIRIKGNDNTHTQKTDEPTEQDFNEVIEALINLYAYLFIAYFEKNRFGSNSNITRTFSLLPPIIRYKVLHNLYKNDKSNCVIIDKLVLATIKAKDKNAALDWINREKTSLQKISHLSKEDKVLLSQLGDKYLDIIPQNMYDYSKEKIEQISELLDSKGVLYKNFEEAKDFYEKNGYIEESSDEIKEFNSIMKFCYIGRKKFPCSKDSNSYHIANLTFLNP